MKIFNIGGEEYKVEFTIEASLYGECIEKITNLMFSIGEASEGAEENESLEKIKEMVTTMSDIPQTALTMFYAGLLENHGVDSGDGRIRSKRDAKLLLRQYFNEHKEDGKGNFYDLANDLIEVMADDDFFRQIGLGQMMEAAEETTKTPKQPQDHKKKATRTTKATEK